jgi:EAL domain-containing protein (putative c-di-GMP-specific phosphodiesterase class I)
MFLDSQDVRRAFGEDEFFPFFQPIVELATGRLTGFEALARWNHARLGAIAPDAFIPIVLRCGFIHALTQRLLAKTFAAAPLLPASLGLSVNLSPHQLVDRTLPGQIAAVARRGGFPLERLTVELNESTLIEYLHTAQAVAGDLKALGCRLALDDFGTVHSSLFLLQALPFDELKIDRSFVHSATEGRESGKIVAAVVSLAHSLGLTTVAQGVETEEQAAAMMEFRCDLSQGWLFGRPAGAGDIPRMVSETPNLRYSFTVASAQEGLIPGMKPAGVEIEEAVCNAA